MKSFKISDALDTADAALLIGIELKPGRLSGNSISKIKNKVMDDINGGGQILYVFADSKKHRLKFGIIAASLAVLIMLPIGVFAAGKAENLSLFFQNSVKFLSGKTQEIKLASSSNNVTMCVENAVNDDQTAAVIFSFTKDDGSPFDKDITSDANFLGEAGMGWSFQKKLSDDSKKLIYCATITGNGKFSQKKLSLNVSNLYVPKKIEGTSALDLKSLFDSNPLYLNNETIGFSNNKLQNFDFPIISDLKNLKLKGIAFNNGELNILSEYNTIKNESLGAILLIKKTTGEKLNPIYYENIYGQEIKDIYHILYRFDISTADNLKDWKLAYNYSTAQNVINGNWHVDFTLQRVHAPVTKKLHYSYQDKENNTVMITDITISMLSVKFEGFLKNTQGEIIQENLYIPIQVDTGEITKADIGSVQYDQKTKKFIYESRLFNIIDTSEIKSIVINNHEIFLDS